MRMWLMAVGFLVLLPIAAIEIADADSWSALWWLLPWLLGSAAVSAWVLLSWLAAPLAVPVVRTVRTRTDGPSLNGALAGTGQLQLAFCVLLSAGLLAS